MLEDILSIPATPSYLSTVIYKPYILMSLYNDTYLKPTLFYIHRQWYWKE